MTLTKPFEISARLLPCLRIGKDSFISIKSIGRNSEGREVFEYYIDTPTFKYEASDLRSGVGGYGGEIHPLQQAMSSLLAFLDDAGERYMPSIKRGGWGPNDAFPENVAEWAYLNQDEISMLRFELDENGPKIGA